MNGKYYGVYDLKNEDACVGVFESINEIAAFFGGIRRNRIECAIVRKNPIALKNKRYWVEVYETPSTAEVRRLMRERFGFFNYKICDDGVYIRGEGRKGWRLFASDFEEAVELCG